MEVSRASKLMLLLTIIYVVLFSDVVLANDAKLRTPMLDILDATQQLMTGEGQFDRNVYRKLRLCMRAFDPRLPRAQDTAWQGVIDYWDTRGAPDDRWGFTPTTYFECNITQMTLHNMRIYEPCNFSSNMAYYHSVLEICKRGAFGRPFAQSKEYVIAYGKALSFLSVASFFFHGSNTKLGLQQDVDIIGLLGYIIHQGSLSSLPVRSSILYDLSIVPRRLSSLQIINAMQNMYISKPVGEWYNITKSLNIPDQYLVLAAFVGTAIHISFEPIIADEIMQFLLREIELPKKEIDFLLHYYLPELKKATRHLNRKNVRQSRFAKKTVGSLTKMFQGLIWQEKSIITDPIIFDPIINFFGNLLIPKLIRILNKVTNFEYFKEHFQNGKNVYPGEEWCNPVNPHAKWHIQGALAAVDILYLGDEMFRLLAPEKRR